MGAIDKDRHRPWLAYALEESLGRSLLAPRDVLDYVNPDVLVAQLPTPVISELFSRALAAGTFTPAQVLESAPPALLAEHLDPEVMWRCLKEAADRGGLSKKGGTRSASGRQWFASVLGRALDTDLIAPADVLRFLPPPEFVTDAPRPVMAELIKTALLRGTFDAALVLQHLTPTVIAEHLETSLVWACIAEAAARHFELGAGADRRDEPSPARTMTNAMAAATVKPTPRPIDRDKPAPTGEKRVAGLTDKAAPVASVASAPSAATVSAAMAAAAAAAAGTPAVTVRPLGSAASPGRVEGAPARIVAPVAPVVSTSPAAPAARADVHEWSPADDLDVLEDQPLPFPLPR